MNNRAAKIVRTAHEIDAVDGVDLRGVRARHGADRAAAFVQEHEREHTQAHERARRVDQRVLTERAARAQLALPEHDRAHEIEHGCDERGHWVHVKVVVGYAVVVSKRLVNKKTIRQGQRG